MKLILISLLTFFSSLSVASQDCISKEAAQSSASNLFIDEYFGESDTAVFPEFMFSVFYEDAYQETAESMASLFLHSFYKFNKSAAKHEFESYHFKDQDEQDELIYSDNFVVEVSCAGEVSAYYYSPE